MNEPAARGMKARTIRRLLRVTVDDWLASIEDPVVRDLAAGNTIVTGGCIASMLRGDPVNDYDLYFRTIGVAEKVARYYVDQFRKEHNMMPDHGLAVTVTDARVRVTTQRGYRGETSNPVTLEDPGEIEDTYEETQDQALTVSDDKKYRPIFLSTNAITLSNKVQVILRFFGEADAIHENFDFEHCTNYWQSWTQDEPLVLRPKALEALLARELRYVGSKYPICSVMRLRKFIKRGWVINAGQILKMMMQVSELDLTDPKVLEDQLTGVDSAFFTELLVKLREKDPEKVNTAYLVEIINRMF